MEESMISTNYMSKAPCSSSDESSWTFYIDQDLKGYPNCGTEDEYESEADSLLLSGYQSGSSIDSDPTCSALKKHRHDNNVHHLEVPSQRIGKRRKLIVACVDDDDDELKDTASSPDNSPKVMDFNQLYYLYKNSKEMIHPRGFFKEHNFLQKLNNQQDDVVCSGDSKGEGDRSNQETEGTAFLGKESYYSRAVLRRKGLCLAPVSMLFNRTVS